MIEFRQKEFIAPVIAAALIGAGGSAIGAGGGIIAGKKQNEAQAAMQRKQMAADKKARLAAEEEEKKNRELEEKKIKMAEQQEKRLTKLAKRNPQAAAAITPTITVSSGNSGGELKENTYAAIETVTSLIGAGGQAATAIGQVRAAKLEGQAQVNAAKANAAGTIATANANKSASQYEANVKMQALKNAEKDNRRQYNLAKKEIGNTYKLNKKTKTYSKVKEGAGFVKNLGTLAKERGLNKVLAGAAIAGAVSGTGSYLVDKAIQKNAKKSGILKIEKPELTEEEKVAKKKKRNKRLLIAAGTTAALAGGTIAARKGALGKDMQDIAKGITAKTIRDKVKSGANTVKESAKDYFAPKDEYTGKRRPDTLNLALTGVSTVAPALMYAQKKKQLKDQISQSERDEEELREKEKNYSKGKSFKINRQSLNKLRDIGESQFFRGRSEKKYKGTAPDMALKARTSNLYNKKGRTERYKVKDWVKKFKNKPGETLLDTLSFRTGGGGLQGVRGFGNDLEKIGKNTGNVTSQRVGQFIKEHPKTSMAGSAVVGGVIIRGARNKLSGATSKAIEKIDPNAYAYAKYGAQPINYQDQDEEEERNG